MLDPSDSRECCPEHLHFHIRALLSPRLRGPQQDQSASSVRNPSLALYSSIPRITTVTLHRDSTRWCITHFAYAALILDSFDVRRILACDFVIDWKLLLGFISSI
ncbi:hypothetical protein PMIN06_001665 [Paraphaeosphaeria minitans]